MASAGPAATGRSLTVRQVTVLFFLGVAVCAIFFAFGFVIGKNQNASGKALSEQQVAPHSEIPPTVNPSAQESQPSANPPASASMPGSSPGIVEQDLKGAATPPPLSASTGRSSGQTMSPPQSQTASSNSAAASSRARSSEPRGIMVQVAASHTEGHARSLVNHLRAQGFRAILIAPRGGSLYRVQVGPFSSRQQATRTLRELSRDGFRPFIREK